MTVTRTQAEAIATAVGRCRPTDWPEWQHAGIVAAVVAAGELGSATDVAVAAFRLSSDRPQRTPAQLSRPGPWWGGTTVGARKPPTPCGLHPDQPSRCPICEAELRNVDHAAGVSRCRTAARTAPRYVEPAVAREAYQAQVRVQVEWPAEDPS